MSLSYIPNKMLILWNESFQILSWLKPYKRNLVTARFTCVSPLHWRPAGPLLRTPHAETAHSSGSRSSPTTSMRPSLVSLRRHRAGPFTCTSIMTLNTSSFLFKGKELHFRLFCLSKRLEVYPVLYNLPQIWLNHWKIFWTYEYFYKWKLSEWIAWDQTEERSGIWVLRAI